MHSESSTAPWQNEFLLTTFALNAQNGDEDAQKLAEWVSRFVTGRVGPEGLPLPIASCYYVYMREDINGRVGNWYTNWQQVQARVFPDSVGVPVENLVTTGYPGSPVSFNAYLLGTCAAVYNIGVESGKVGYDRYSPTSPAPRFTTSTQHGQSFQNSLTESRHEKLPRANGPTAYSDCTLEQRQQTCKRFCARR